MHQNNLTKLVVLVVALMLQVQIGAPAASIQEDLGGGTIAVGQMLTGKPAKIGGRRTERKGVLLEKSQAAWPLSAQSSSTMVEFWMRPWSWQPYSKDTITIAEIAFDSGERLLIRKPASAATLELFVNEAPVGAMPIYDWMGEAIDRAKTQPDAWHLIAIEVNKDGAAWAVDGFLAGEVEGKLQTWKSARLILGDAASATGYADLAIRPGAKLGRGEVLRRQFRANYKSEPDLNPALVTAPYLAAAPADDAALREWVRQNGTKLVAFTSPKNNRLVNEPLTGYLAYDDQQIYLLMSAPYQGTLKASQLGHRDGSLPAQESFEIFLQPPLTDIAEYVQLVGNPYGDQMDLRSYDISWNGQWQWQTSRKTGEWEGLLIAPFAGLSLPNPGNAAIWTGNIFNTEAGAVWAWTSGAYNNTKVFGTVKFSRRAPVIRPDNPVVQNDAISVPVTIRALNAGGRFEATLDFYSTGAIFPVTSAQQEVVLEKGQSGQAQLKVPLHGADNGLVTLSVRDGEELLYYKSFLLPVEPPRVREGVKPVVASVPAETKVETKQVAAPRELSPEQLAQAIHEAQEWKGSRLGIADKVPAPWTPVKATNGVVELWNRRYDLQNALLPQQITSADKSLLAAPMRLRLTGQGKEFVFSKADSNATAQENETGAVVTASQTQGAVKASVTSKIEFDGMMKVSLELQSSDAQATYDGLTLEIPLRGEEAKLFHYTASYSGLPSASDSGFVPVEGFKLDRLREIVWLGSNREGLCWFTEGMENWPIWNEKNIIVLEAEKAGSRVLRIKLGDRPFRLGEPLKLVFGLQATPMRARPDNFRSIADQRSFYFPWYRGDGHYIPWNVHPEPFRKQVQEYRAKGREVMPVSSLRYYGKYNFFANDFYELPDPGLIRPEVYLWGALWQTSAGEKRLPEYPASQVARGNWMGKKFQPNDLTAFCARSTFQDFYIWKLHDLIETTDVGALYLDQPLTRCANPAHGCGYVNYKGEWTTNVPIFAMRDMVKRIYQLFYEKHGKTLIRWHSSNQLIIPCLAFVDVNWDGENYNVGSLAVGEFYSKLLPPGRLQAQHSGLPFGFTAELLPEFTTAAAPSPASVRDMMGLMMVHDSNVFPAWTAHNDLVTAIQNRRLEFPFEGSTAIYYWDNDPRVQVQTPNVLSIAHVKPGGDMLYIFFNDSDTPAQTKSVLDLKALGFKGKEARVLDFYSGEELGTTSGALTMDVAPRDFRMLRLQER